MDRILLSLAAIALSGHSADAQQGYRAEDVPRIESLEPLATYLARPDEEKIPFYPFQRCAGLFLGYIYYAGATFDAGTKQQVDSSAKNLSFAAITVELVRTAERLGVAVDELPETLLSQTSRRSSLQMQGFAFYYADRMEANYLSDGAAYSEDQLIAGDLELCGHISRQASDFAARLGAASQ